MPPSDRDLVANRFRSLFVIGRGGMGWVEVALEQGDHSFERIVALKRMLPESSIDRHHIDMFMREAHVAELLSHPNVVHAFAFGEDKGELFLAMEYVEGEPLSRVHSAAHKQEGQLAAPIVAHILAEICEGLHAAHELCDPANGKPLNLIHRDISPHNVMVAYDGYVKLLDFGVVKIDQLEAKGGRTKTGEVKGKTAYMSPEQAMGEPLDRRSDLYSLGAVLFECIAGQRMWGMGTDFDVLRRLALEEPPRLEDVAPHAPRALCVLQRRLVARNRDERPPTARAVGQELRRFIADTGTHPDTKVVRAVMGRLFRQEIDRRQEALANALDVAAPNDADELRKSLVTGFSATRIELPSVEARPVVVRARGTSSAPPPALGTSGQTLRLSELVLVPQTAVAASGQPAGRPSPDWGTTPEPAGDEQSDGLPLKPRVLPWAIGASALLVLGAVAGMRWVPAQRSAATGATASVPVPVFPVPPIPSTTAQLASATPKARGATPEPKPPHVGTEALATTPSAPPVYQAPPAPVTPSGPPVGATPAKPPKSGHGAGKAQPGPSPLPLDENPI